MILKRTRHYMVAMFILITGVSSGVIRLSAQAPAGRTETEVSFQTEDGKTIIGTLHMPKAGAQKVPGIIMFAEAGWIVRTTLEAPGRDMAEKSGLAVLTADHRGNAKSMNGKEYY